MARDYVMERMQSIGLKPYVPNYTQHFEVESPDGFTLAAVNVLGMVEGFEAGPVMVISAHYDHLGVLGGKIYNGADDNASGVGAMLAMAQYFAKHQPNHTIIFAAFDAEEVGLRGSQHFVESLVAQADSITFNINLDMVSRSDTRNLFACGTYHTPYVKPWLQPLTDSAKWRMQLRFGHDRPRSHREDWTYSSDHGNFHKAGIPFIYFGVEDHLDYHEPTDIYWSINEDFYLSAVELMLEAAITLDEGLGDVAALQQVDTPSREED